MADQLLTLLKDHFLKKDVGDRARTISEWSVVEQWFRMEMYLCLRSNGEDWSIPLVEGPYCTRLPTGPPRTKSWEERQKWCDLVAIGRREANRGVHWLELKAIWYRRHTWKNNLNSALRDFLALAAMDPELTTQIWARPSGGASSYRRFLENHAEDIRNGPHHRYSICLLQAFPESLLADDSAENLKVVSRRYLTYKSQQIPQEGVDVDLTQSTLPSETKPDPLVRVYKMASKVTPEMFRLGDVDRDSRFPEKNPRGELALAVWKVPQS